MQGKDISSKLTAQLIKEASERKHAEALINVFVKNAPGALAVVDASFNYQSISDKWYAYFDLEHQDLIGDSLLKLSTSFTESSWDSKFKRALSGEHLRGSDEQIITAKGIEFWVNWELVPWSNQDGKVGGIVVSIEVLNEKKRLVKALKETTEVLQMAVNSSGMGFWQWDEKKDELVWDEGMFNLFQVSREEFTGKGSFFLSRLHESDRPTVRQILESTLKSSGEYHTKYRVITRSGVRVIKEHGKVFEDEGIIRMTGICEDISEEEKLKQDLENLNHSLEQKIQERTVALERAYEETRSLTYSLSHDLRAPLNAISAYVELIKEEGDEALGNEFHSYFKRIDSNSKKTIRLIDDLLAYSRVIHQKLNFEQIEFDSFLKAVLTEFDADQVERVEIISGQNFYGDSTTLKQAFCNLIDNALKFSSDKIEISGEATYDKSLIYIKDFGIGFSMEDESKIYEVFRKLNPDEEYEGIGIGLPLTKRILEINDGLISVKSTKDEGTTFTVALPLRG